VGCSAPAFFGGARFSQTTALLRTLVGEQLGRCVAAVGAPPAPSQLNNTADEAATADEFEEAMDLASRCFLLTVQLVCQNSPC
jgi:hypothetical protein